MEKKIIILISVVTLVWCLRAGVVVEGFCYDDKEIETEEGKLAMYERWRSHHQMEDISATEIIKQYETFKANLEHVHNTNKANKPYKLELNRFAGMTHEEVMSKYTGLKSPPPHKIRLSRKVSGEEPPPAPFRYRNCTDLPPEVDWRAKGAVTRAKSQESCGCCYAFSAIDAVEGMHFVKTKKLIELSPKEILDCAKIGGCDGGRMTTTFEYIEKNGGVTTAKNYPFKPKVEPCNLKKEQDIVVHVGGHELVPNNDEESLMKAVAHQPVSVAIDVNKEFGMYKEGVLTAPCGHKIGHGVLLIGYGTTPDGTKYWLVKNSWGAEWGDNGVIKMLRGGPDKAGYCGIQTDSSYPTPDKTTDTPHKKNEPIVHSTGIHTSRNDLVYS